MMPIPAFFEEKLKKHDFLKSNYYTVDEDGC
jgi:hypothetical protein